MSFRAAAAACLVAGCVPSAPAWSPDGGRVAFVTPTDLSHTLWVFDAATGAEAARWATEEVVLAPRWTPDGRLSFASVPETGRRLRFASYWIWTPGSGPPERLFRQAADARGVYALSMEWRPAGFGPTGSGDALYPVRAARGRYEVWLRPGRGRRRALLAGPRDVALARWSPDGARIAYLARAEAVGVWDLRSAGADGGDDRLLVPAAASFPAEEDALPPGDLFAPVWSSDGARVAFVRAVPVGETGPRLSVRGEIWTVDAEGRGPAAPAARPPGSAGAPAWAPGGRIAFVAGRDAETAEIFLADLSTSGDFGRAVAAADATGGAGAPAWAPGGRRLAWRAGPAAEGAVRVRDLATGADLWLPTTAEGLAAAARRRLAAGDAAGAAPLLDRAATAARAEAARRGETP